MYLFKRLKNFIKLPVLYFIIVVNTINLGCATMLEGSRQKTKLHCEPSDKVVAVVDGEEMTFSDGLILLDKKRDTHFVTLKREGYHSTTLAFDREVNPSWFFANLIWLPAAPIAWLVDWTTASIYQLNPKDVKVVLREKEEVNESFY